MEGVVVDEKGAPVEGAFAWLPYPDSPGPAGDVGRSDRDGRYRIHVRSTDRRTLVAHPDGRAATVEILHERGPGGRTSLDKPSLGRAVLAPVPPITGRVVDSAGGPVDGVVVMARPENSSRHGIEISSGGFRLRQPPTLAATGPDGRFSVPASLPLPHWLSLPAFEGGRLGIRSDFEGEPKHLVEEGVVLGTPGGDPALFRVIHPAILPFTVVDAKTGSPVRRVTITFTRAVPDWSPTSGERSFTGLTTGDWNFVLAARNEQPLSVGGVGYRTRAIESLRALPKDRAGRFVVGLEADDAAPMLRLRWDPALECGEFGVTLLLRERGTPPPRENCDGVDSVRPSPEGGAADFGPPDHGPLRWIFDAPGQVLIGAEWLGNSPDVRVLAPVPEALISVRWKDRPSAGKLGVAVKNASGKPLPFRCATDYGTGSPAIFYVHDPGTGAEIHDAWTIGTGILLGGLPGGRVTLVLKEGEKRSERTIDLTVGKTTILEMP